MKYLHESTPTNNFVAFYADGSGAGVFTITEGIVYDSDGDGMGGIDWLIESGYNSYMDLPDDFEFWWMK